MADVVEVAAVARESPLRRLALLLDAPPDLADAPPRPLEKVLLVAVVLLFASVGYFGVGLLTDPTRAATLATPLDRAIPHLPWSIYVYAWVYTAMFYPGFTVRCPYVFRRVILAYLVVLVACFACWMAFPVTAHTIRPDLAGIPPTTFHGWGVHVNYVYDPPVNLFPSLHVAAATLATTCAWRVRPAFGIVALPVALAIWAATCTMKQHFFVDGLSGALLGLAAWWWLLRPARTGGRGPGSLAYGWGGPLLYVVFHCSVYGVMFLLYLSGWVPR